MSAHPGDENYNVYKDQRIWQSACKNHSVWEDGACKISKGLNVKLAKG